MSALLEVAAAATASPRMRATSAPREAAAASPRMRATSALRAAAAESPRVRTTRAQREAAAASPRIRATSAPREETAEVGPSQPISAPREVDEASAAPRKKARTASRQAEAASVPPQLGIPVAWFLPERYDIDLWTEVAKHLAGSDLIRLSCTCRWLHDLLVDDTIWRYAFYRDLDLFGSDSISRYPSYGDLHLPIVKPVPHRYWYLLYVAAVEGSQVLLHKDNELGVDGQRRRVNGLLVEGELLATVRLQVPKLPLMHADSLQHAIEMTGTCLLTNACPGVWVADMQIIKCPGCNIARCTGSKQVLDVHHCDFLLEQVHSGDFENEEIGHYSISMCIPSAFCAIFNSMHMNSPSTDELINVNSWNGYHKDLKTRTRCFPYAVGLNTNLQGNKGMLSVFEAVRDMGNKGQLVWIRISQVL